MGEKIGHMARHVNTDACRFLQVFSVPVPFKKFLVDLCLPGFGDLVHIAHDNQGRPG